MLVLKGLIGLHRTVRNMQKLEIELTVPKSQRAG